MKKIKILVINTKFLGDLIVSSPGIRSLRKTYPNAEIVFLLRKGFEDILIDNPNINKIISFDPELKGNFNFVKMIGGVKFIKKIKSEKFDLVIALHPGDRIAFWSWFSKAKQRIAPRKQSFGFLFNNLVDVYENSINYIEYYNKIFNAAGVTIDSNRTEFFISNNANQWANECIKRNNLVEKNILIGIHPGASEPSKMWKKENFKLLIDLILSVKNCFIILFEGPQDEEIFKYLKNSIDNKNLLFIKTNILNVAALIKKCRLFVTHDTGTRHLAVAVGTPTIALIPEDNKKYWDFYSEQQNHYSIIGKRNIPMNDKMYQPFLDGINVDIVYEKIISIIGR